MKTKIRNFVFLIFLVGLIPEVLFPQTYSFKIFSEDVTKSKDTSKVMSKKNSIPWSNSFYISSGYGVPQGLRIELGYNFGRIISLGGLFGKFDNWSHGDPTFGVCGKLNFIGSSFTSYLLIGYGGSVALFGEEDTYTFALIGFRRPLKNWVYIRPEIGLVFTSKYISGGGIFSNSPITREKETKFAFNVSLELDLRQIL